MPEARKQKLVKTGSYEGGSRDQRWHSGRRGREMLWNGGKDLLLGSEPAYEPVLGLGHTHLA